ncbi:hypothetical protein GCM10010503_66570 [Streptomyces lucensis JCM 4490]|uniref:Carrier domain-containing protein n=1 Tax=Streptomyces lucensis JCM 4490 TaxID=1306176 RepID=A0A918JGC7_9ACTN|nr:acyl carrier protein [Streptomyces lucensis]GGW79628.1 hypothetical protein GCM10010503_66570 [Streptomyces lucensis JCM 4490]
MPTSPEAVYRLVHDTLTTKFELPAAEIRPDATIGELELDSLALAELAVVLSEELGVEVTEEGVTRTTTLDEFAAGVARATAPAGDAAALDAQ